MNFRCFAKSSQSETPSVPFPPENNLHNFRIATIIFSRTQMPYKRFLFGIIFFSNKKMEGINPRGDKRKREWVHSESVTSHRNLSIYPHCVDFPAANKKESFVSNQFLKAHTRCKAAKKGTVDSRDGFTKKSCCSFGFCPNEGK